jgi:hypothetical protein
MISRRSILFGLIAAPVVVRAGLIMPVRALPKEIDLSKMLFVQRSDRMALFRSEFILAYEAHKACLLAQIREEGILFGAGPPFLLRGVPESSNKPLAS